MFQTKKKNNITLSLVVVDFNSQRSAKSLLD